MSDLQTTIAIHDPELDDEELQAYTQNLLPQIREFAGVDEAGLVPRSAIETPGMTAKDFGAVLLGAITVISTIKAVIEIIEWVEKRWLKPEDNQASRRRLSIEVVTPEGYKLTCAAETPEDLKAFREQIVEHLGKG